jgi:hypothetical protein
MVIIYLVYSYLHLEILMGHRKTEATEATHSKRKYLRIKNLMVRYECSRGHITNLIDDGVLPPPMLVNGIKQWPEALIDALDRQREKDYYDNLKSQGFDIPKILS